MPAPFPAAHVIRRLILATLLLSASARADDPPPVAQLTGTQITAADLKAASEPKVLELEKTYAADLAALKVRYQRERAAIVESELERLLSDSVFEAEAKARHSTAEALRAAAKPKAISDADVKAYYDANKTSIRRPYGVAEAGIRETLETESREQAQWDLEESLRKKYRARILREPLRAAVDAVGPSRGPEKAVVTIIEFGDFECPYCAQARGPLLDLLKHYPDSVRLVFRQLPLEDLHAHAMDAARVSVCADEQGLFWKVHDAFYSNQAHLDAASLRATAAEAGADGERLDACLGSGRADTVVKADVDAARALVVDGTPGLFINGRYFSGAQSYGHLRSIVETELAIARQ